ncbi:MAG: UTP--glucose-1-phosphate uridylyltransferase [Mariniblastus sp.]|nr:UTP--glucose-1-phosphate uridylyltransferase [Mariniblastus sp.]
MNLNADQEKSLAGKDKTTDWRSNRLVNVIETSDNDLRNQALDELCRGSTSEELLGDSAALDQLWRTTDNLYTQVRALFFLSAIHRYHLPKQFDRSRSAPGKIPFDSYRQLLERRFIESIDSLLTAQTENGPSDGISSALAQAYHELAFQRLADQVRKSVRTVRGNQWMFRTGHPDDHPLRFRPELLARNENSPAFPILSETTAVRMDFSHSGWSDIFFLGMDFPAGAKVINASINLGVVDRDEQPQPPIECYLRVIDRPVLRLVSIDLKSTAEIQSISEVFDFAADYLGLLKAAVIASGIVPAGMDGCGESIKPLLERLVGPGLGIEIVSKVNDIPKGSRLAVSTNLLGSLISVCMRATGQVSALAGKLTEPDRRIIAARAILGEWIGGSGGGWQDSGGVWPGIKLIEGAEATESDPEWKISRGRLLPRHTIFGFDEITEDTRQKLQDSLVLVHGGMAQNVGPILEMVTEKYLLRSTEEWQARLEAIEILEDIKKALLSGDIRALGEATHRNFNGPLQTIIPWCTNLFTNTLIEKCQSAYGDRFWGFWMLGGMAGGGMGFIFDPSVKLEAQTWLQETMQTTKVEFESRLPFAMDPVVYEFEINDQGTFGTLSPAAKSQMPYEYYALLIPEWLKLEPRDLSALSRFEMETLGAEYRTESDAPKFRILVESILPGKDSESEASESLADLLNRHGFDREQHEQIRADLKSGRYGLAQNRLPINTSIEDVSPTDVIDTGNSINQTHLDLGCDALRDGRVAVVTLAAGVGSRWTEGAGVVKGLYPFHQFAGKHRSFLEVHLAKSNKIGRQHDRHFPHVITTGYLTDQPIQQHLAKFSNYHYPGDVLISPGQYVGLRTIPMMRDLQFQWEEMPQQLLDEQQEKMRASQRSSLIAWARQTGEGLDYRDNSPMQCLHPVGHWYEIPNLIRNGTLKRLLDDHPQLETLLLHNVDTLGANVDPGLLGLHLASKKCLSFEVISRRLEDRGGGLARVNGQPRLLEGLSMPREEDEFKLSYYNSMTTWIDVDRLLAVFGLKRSDLDNATKVDAAIRQLSCRMPTYITIKDVKKRWGHGQEDVFPVSQFEKLWSDMSGLPEVTANYFVVPLARGQQLKQQAQLDAWLRDGTAEYVDGICDWNY